jgi:hypothetical protein
LTIFPTPEFFNGALSVQVVNELTVPMSTIDNDISINVFVSADDDYEVAVPDARVLDTYSYLRPPDVIRAVEVEAQSGDANEQSSKPILDDTGKLMGSNCWGSSEIYHVMFGDPIASVRQILKRFTLHSILVPIRQVDALHVMTRTDFPYYRGKDLGGPHNNGNDAYAAQTFLNWFTPAYTCRRGGIRWKYHIQNNDHAVQGISVQRSEYQAFATRTVAMGGTEDATAKAVDTAMNLRAGGAINPLQQPIAEVELPFYANRRFWAAKSKKFTHDVLESDCHDIEVLTRSPTGGNASFIQAYVAAADDYSLAFFVGAPIMYIYEP